MYHPQANVTLTIVGANYPDYVSQSWHTILIMYAYLLVFGLMNMYAFFLVPYIELMAGFLHIIGWLIFVVVLLTLAPRHTNDFVWFEKANSSGWDSDFVSFNLGIILITWGFVGKRASVLPHVCSIDNHQVSTLPLISARTPGELASSFHEPCSGPSVSTLHLHLE
jgi:amino acid transporter